MHRDPDGVPFIMGKNVGFGVIATHNIDRVTEEFHRSQPKSQIRAGDVVVVRIGKSGQASKVPESLGEANCSGLVIIKQPEKINADFLVYFLNSPIGRMNSISQTRGSTRLTLNTKSVASTMVPVPLLPEQRRIVGILDEAFDSIATAKANTEKNFQNARALFESHLEAVFSQRGEGWVDKSLGDIASVKGGKRAPKGYKLLAEPTDFPYLRVADFSDIGSIDMSNLRYVSADVHRKIKNYVISSADMYLSIAGTIGKTGIIPEELDGANLTEDACRLVFQPGISNRFVYYFKLTADFSEQAGLQTRTAAQPKMALSRLSTIKLGVPSLAIQESLVERFDALREETLHLESIYQQKLAALDALKKSLLHQAFTGAL
jgi:type I restriction enzyme S subunit